MTLSPPADEFERRLRWPALPTLLFLGFLTILLVLAALSLVIRPQHPQGLPDDATLLASAGLPAHTLGVLSAELRFRAAALGGEPGNHSNDAAALARLGESERQLARWTRQHPGEPRVRAALGALALARHDYTAAAGRYREACERSPHYAEGRLGWGTALALDAERTSEPWQRRALMLSAIAQFAAVDAGEPEYVAALYNRARLLAEVGRGAESRLLARRYLALDPASAWAERVRIDLLSH
jgi:tetratricopeptide (TPR) repeat protein